MSFTLKKKELIDILENHSIEAIAEGIYGLLIHFQETSDGYKYKSEKLHDVPYVQAVMMMDAKNAVGWMVNNLDDLEKEETIKP